MKRTEKHIVYFGDNDSYYLITTFSGFNESENIVVSQEFGLEAPHGAGSAEISMFEFPLNPDKLRSIANDLEKFMIRNNIEKV